MFRSKSGLIAATVVGVSLWLLTGFIAKNHTPNIDGMAVIAPGESIGYDIVHSEQTYEGIGVQVEITNNTDKTITEGQGLLGGRNALGVRIMHDYQPLCGGHPFHPGETRTLYFLLWDMELNMVSSFSFAAMQVRFVDGPLAVTNR